MVRRWWKQCAAAVVIGSAASYVLAHEPPEFVEIAVAPPAGEASVAEIADGASIEFAESNPLAEKIQQSKFWIGVSCEPMSEALQAQLNRKQGLWVDAVITDSPASKANIQRHDILLKFNDTELATVEQLVDAVEQHGGKEVTITLLRGGKEETFKVTVVERPKDAGVAQPLGESQVRGILLHNKEVEAEETRLKATIEKGLQWLQQHDKKLDLMVVRPGVAFPADRVQAATWPKDVTVHVHKEGEKPSTIEIKRGDKSWKVTEDKLDELPPDVRMLVEQMRGGGGMKVLVERQAGPDTVRQYRLYANPGTIHSQPLGIPLPATSAVPATRIAPHPAGGPVTAMSGRVMMAPVDPRGALPHAQLDEVNMKLDAILKQLSSDRSVEKLEKEVERLRREVETLREQIKD